MIATTLFGFEDIVAEELHNLGVKETTKLIRAVSFEGDLEMMYRCNLHLRTAIKVLKPLKQFMIRDDRDLYKKIQRIDWEKFLSKKGTLAIDATVNGDYFTHSQFIALKTKDAIVDQFRDNYGIRPSVDLDDPDLRISVHIKDRTCSISLDSSGTTLGKRGYRQAQALAPMSEVLAAGIIALSGWDKTTDFLDPMCGSGTLAIEAAMLACNMAPGSLRTFGFENWKDFDSEKWTAIKAEAETQIIVPNCKIFARDIETRAVQISKSNAQIAGVDKFIVFQQLDFVNNDSHFNNGFIVMNPPYGERLKDEDEIIPFYKEVGTQMKHYCEGSTAWIISSNMRALKFVGLRSSRKIKIFNGPLELRLQKYELFKGKRDERPRD